MNKRVPLPEKYKGLLFACGTAFLWGFLPIGLKYALQYTDTLTIATVRFAIAFFLLLAFYFFNHRDQLKYLVKPPLLAVMAGLGLAANYLGYMQGLNLTSPGNAQIFIQTGPLCLAVIGFFYFKETVRKRQLIGIILSGMGIFLFHSDQIQSLISNQEGHFIGNLWILFAALTWAGWGFCQKLLGHSHQPQTINLIVYGIGFLCFLPKCHFPDLLNVPWDGQIMLFLLGLNTLVAYGLLSEALKRAPANQVSLIITVNPLITLLTVGLISGYHFSWLGPIQTTPMGYFGGVILVLGVMLVVYKRKS